MAEALVTFPVFILLWLGMMYYQDLVVTALQLEGTAAHKALASAGSGACTDYQSAPKSDEEQRDQQQMESSFSEQDPEADMQQTAGWIATLSGAVPWVMAYAEAGLSQEVQRGDVFSGTAKANRRYLCNMEPSDADSLVERVGEILKSLLDKAGD